MKTLEKFDLGKVSFLIFLSIIFFVHCSQYYFFCFPNCYAWKELMIMWVDGEIVRRGLLGTVFFALEPEIPIYFSAPFVLYLCIMLVGSFIYTNLKKLQLPLWLFLCLILSPALLVFNLHYSLTLRKDIVCIAGLIILLNFIKWFFDKKFIFRLNIVLFSIVFLFVSIFFSLCYEVFFVFVPFLILYIFTSLQKNNVGFGYSLFYSLSVLFLYLLIYSLIVFPYIGDYGVAFSIASKWHELYDSLAVYPDSSDPLVFLSMEKDKYLDCYFDLLKKSNLIEVVYAYLFQLIPVFFILKFKLLKLTNDVCSNAFYNNHKKICWFVFICLIHVPLCLSAVAFDYGRWLVFVNYLFVIFLCFYTEHSDLNVTTDCSTVSLRYILPYMFALFYILGWQHQHWFGGDLEFFSFTNQLKMYANICFYLFQLLTAYV